jgi:hypothetical protein
MAVYIGENTLKPLSPVNTMSSTSGVQNLLTNVFRPTFVYDTTNGVYQSKLELTNIDTVSASTVSTYSVSAGDANFNVYVGVNAGNVHSVMATQNNYNNTFVGASAGRSTSNVRNSVFIGYLAGNAASNSSNNVAIGSSTNVSGNSNVFIGYSTGIPGNNNIFIGAGMTNNGSSASNLLLIGNSNNATIIGDLSTNRVGINMSSLPITTPYISLDVGGYARISNGLGIGKTPGYYSLDVNGTMQVSDGYGTLTFTNDGLGNSLTTISNTSSYSSCNATLQVTGGVFSVSGTITIPGTSSSNIGILKKGIVLASAQDSTVTTVYASRMYMVSVSNTTYTTSSMANSSVLSSITNSGTTSNLVLSNTDGSSHTFTYSITYFPSP